MLPELLQIENGFNFRELGGYQTTTGKRIKKHKLLRSAALNNLSEKDLQYLDEYGLRYDIDFRSPEEQKRQPDRLPAQAAYHFAPVFTVDETKSQDADRAENEMFLKQPNAGFKQMLNAYNDIVLSDNAKKAYRKFIDLMLANSGTDESVIFHCSAGKDRTGMGAVYALTILGVDQETIRSDYLASNVFLEQRREFKPFSDRLPAKLQTATYLENMKALSSVSTEYLDCALGTMQREYGTLEHYIETELGVTKQQKTDLQRIYLEG
ncbi:protein tyrosine phosphatase [Ligilactobacillus salitolerans]|uniref:Protein tyrosine phosphatase n=1 Tax=Ligilactobacillus salitolerans TaxID=1808352 RepID=A0A401ITI9_9LACO|nr:tyrosine-protein phosphatase [Ligilactobacillus salitolerans]GBG94815.1 protein tyrosine phosphatase [Ligilactobacillus salitolerans]